MKKFIKIVGVFLLATVFIFNVSLQGAQAQSATAKPNLVAESPDLVGEKHGASNKFYTGEIINVGSLVSNTGNAIALTSTVEFQYSYDNKPETFVPWFTVYGGAIKPGASVNYQDKRYFGGTGTIYLRAVVDNTSSVSESNEKDNISASTVIDIIEGPAGTPSTNILIDAPDLVGEKHGSSDKFYLGENISIGSFITNKGTARVEAPIVSFQYSSGDSTNFQPLFSVTGVPLNPGASSNVKDTRSFLYNTGTVYIRASVNGKMSDVTKFQIIDKPVTTAINATTTSNLTPVTPVVTGAGTGVSRQFYTGRMVTISSSVINNGSGTVRGTDAVIQSSIDGTNFTDLYIGQIPPLLANLSYKVAGYQTVNYPGVRYYRTIVDRGGVISESNENDNISPVTRVTFIDPQAPKLDNPIIAPTVTRPNLTADSPDLIGAEHGSSGVLYNGESVNVGSYVSNMGNGPSAYGTNVIIQSSEDGTNFIDWVTSSVPALNNGSSINVTSNKTISNVGTIYLRAIIDRNNSVAESNENDNMSGLTKVSVVDRPVVKSVVPVVTPVVTPVVASANDTSVKINLTPSTPVVAGASTGVSGQYYVGGMVTVSSTVVNSEDTASLGTDVVIQSSTDGTNFQDLYVGQVPSLTKSLYYRATGYPQIIGPGVRYFRTIVDRNNAVSESNEGDNISPVTRVEFITRPVTQGYFTSSNTSLIWDSIKALFGF